MKKLSLRARLTLWTGAFILVLASLMLICMIYLSDLSANSYARDELLQIVASNVDELMLADDGTLVIDEGFDFISGDVDCQVWTVSGDLIEGQFPKGMAITPALLDGKTQQLTINSVDYLYYSILVEIQDKDAAWISGLTSVSDEATALTRMFKLALYLLPALVIIAIWGGWLFAGHALKPVQRITDTANAISDGKDLSARIGLAGDGDEIHQLAATFDNMFSRLEQSFEAEKQFTSDASHELRTPTTVILAECRRAHKKATDKADFERSLAVIERQANKISRLITQLLNITRMEQGTEKVRLEKADLSSFTAAVCDEFLPPDTRGIQLQTAIEPGLQYSFDQALLSRLLQNLLENAYKYGKENGLITVSLRHDTQTEQYLLQVADDGQGIAPEDLPHIWQRFWQADSSRSQDQGMGLGLPIVRQIATLHGGTIAAESTLGQGSVFTLTLPPQNFVQ